MSIHKPVLLKEAIAGLKLRQGSVVVDATVGGGGHASEILRIIGGQGRLIAIDQDQAAIDAFRKQLPAKIDNVVFAKDNFSNVADIVGGQGRGSVDGVLADLGYSSDQLEDPRYGMSFLHEARLDMRLDSSGRLTAAEIVNRYPPRELEKIIRNLGEERFAKNIVDKICEFRKKQPIETTSQLAEIIASAVPGKYRRGRLHPATRTFQALRIAVNRELENLEKFIPAAIAVLRPGGRLAIITFHSLEDRIVKNIFRENARGCICPPNFPTCQCGHEAGIKIMTRKPIAPDQAEIAANPRARSAKLRICEKI